jgi:hypothetical protein
MAGCGGGTASSAPTTIDTLATGTIVVHNRDGGLWAPGKAWRAEELVRIGEKEGDDPYVFGQITDVKLGPEGQVYVLDAQAQQLRIFDARGRFERSVGREGEGPGEFRMPSGMVWGPDGNLWVVDVRNQRYTVVSPAGALVTTYRRAIGGYSWHWDGGFDVRGELYDPSYYMDPTTHESRQVFVGERVQHGEVVAVDTSTLPTYEAHSYRVDHPNGGYSVLWIPYTPRLTWRFDGNDGFWAGTGETYRLWHLTLAGDTSRIVELDRKPLPVTDEDRARARRQIETVLQNRGGLDQIDFSRIPHRKPAFGSLVLDDHGWIWVARTQPAPPTGEPVPPTTFDVFDPVGRYYGAVTMDVSMAPPPDIVGDHVAGVVRDSLGVQRVVVYRIDGRMIDDT